MKDWRLRGLFQNPRVREDDIGSFETLVRIVALAMRYRAWSGDTWPDGTAEEIARLMLGHPQRIAVRIAEREMIARNVGGPHSFTNGAGI